MKNKEKKEFSSILILLVILAVLSACTLFYLSAKNKKDVSLQDTAISGNSSANSDASSDIAETSLEDGFISYDSSDLSFYGPEFPEEQIKNQEIAGPMPSLPASDEENFSDGETNPAAPSEQPDNPSEDSDTDISNNESMRTILTQVKGLFPTDNGSWSVYICDLTTGTQGTVNEMPMQAASLIKLYIMGTVYEDYDALTQQYGYETINSSLTSMITVSDNDSANTLVSYLGNGDSAAGMAKVNAFCQNHGYHNTSMGRLLLASKEYGDNYTSVADCGKFLKEIYQISDGISTNSGLSHAEEMYSLLKQQQRNNKIPAALPDNVLTAHKTGELSDVENDAGILYNTALGNDLVICFMSESLTDTLSAQHTISELSRVIYDFYNE